MIGRRRHPRRSERGTVALLAALLAVTLFAVAAFAVDLGNVWARRGSLQVQADQAALYAAESLPAVDAASRLAAATKVAYYIACHPVMGQEKLTPQIPSCSDATTPESAAIIGYAETLLATSAVTFPTTTRVRVVTPPADVEFGFAGAAGADHSVQQKVASAEVSSPGDLMPIGLSLNCLLHAATQVPAAGDSLAGVVPLDYVSPGPIDPADEPTSWPGSQPTSATIKINTAVTTPKPVTVGSPATYTIHGSGWGVLASVEVWFAKGDTLIKTKPLSVQSAGGTATGALPTAVTSSPGTWHVKVSVKPNGGSSFTWSEGERTIQVGLPASAQDAIGCGRLLDSPRADTVATTGGLAKNLQSGLDHGLAAHPELGRLNPPSMTVSGLLAVLGNTAGAFSCASGAPDVTDVKGVAATPNCVVVKGGGSTASEFTAGLVDSVRGRLTCTTTRPCDHGSFSISGRPGQFNDDELADYVTDEDALTSSHLFDLAAYAERSLTAASPDQALGDSLYGSARFFWVPVVSTPSVPQAAGSYPIVTFRPVFVTQDPPSGLAGVDLVRSVLGETLSALLGLTTSEHGLVLAGGQLKAMKLMTIEPDALPLIGAEFDGPTTPYLGLGPKVIHLVE